MPLDTFRPRPGLPGAGTGEGVVTPRQPVQPGVIAPTTSPVPPPLDPYAVTPMPNNPTVYKPPTSPGTSLPLYPEPNFTVPPNSPYPEPAPGTQPVTPRPLYPGGPNMGIPGGPGSLNPQPLPEPAPGTGAPGGVPPGLANYAPPTHDFSPGQVVGNSLDNLLSSENRYIQNARQRGREEAASRGLLNSSISAGAAERSGIEASMPILDQIMGLHNNREGMANASLEAQRDRMFQSEFAVLDANVQDWLHNNQYNREWNGQLAMLPIASASEMWSGLMQLAASDPTVFTPDVLAGYQDFFQTGFNEYISRYLQPPQGG